MATDERNPILQHSFEFSLMVLEYADLLIARHRFTIAHQVSKSGTSIGANVEEAQEAESKDDFIHKMKIAAKECRETRYWLRLCSQARDYPDCSLLLTKISEIRRILNKIIGTSKIRYQQSRRP